jgi:hypothetical protein
MTVNIVWAGIVVLVVCGPVVAGELSVWIDTDPACAIGSTHDVDDCWAIIAACHEGDGNRADPFEHGGNL